MAIDPQNINTGIRQPTARIRDRYVEPTVRPTIAPPEIDGIRQLSNIAENAFKLQQAQEAERLRNSMAIQRKDEQASEARKKEEEARTKLEQKQQEAADKFAFDKGKTKGTILMEQVNNLIIVDKEANWDTIVENPNYIEEMYTAKFAEYAKENNLQGEELRGLYDGWVLAVEKKKGTHQTEVFTYLKEQKKNSTTANVLGEIGLSSEDFKIIDSLKLDDAKVRLLQERSEGVEDEDAIAKLSEQIEGMSDEEVRQNLSDNYVMDRAVSIQAHLDDAYAYNSKLGAEVAQDTYTKLLERAATGSNPHLAYALSQMLRSGTGLLKDTKASKALLEEKLSDIEENMYNQSVSIEQRLVWHSATSITQPAWSEQDWKDAEEEIKEDKNIPDDIKFKLLSELLSNKNASLKERNSLTKDTGVNVIRAHELIAGGKLSFGQIKEETGVPDKTLTRLMEAQAMRILVEPKEDGTVDIRENAQKMIQYITTTPHFDGATLKDIPAQINTTASDLVYDNVGSFNLKEARQAFELWRVVDANPNFTQFKLSENTNRVFSAVRNIMTSNEDMGFETALATAKVNTNNFNAVPDPNSDWTPKQVKEALMQEEFTDLLNEAENITPRTVALFSELMNQFDPDGIVDGQTTFNRVRDMFVDNGVSIYGNDENERLIQLPANSSLNFSRFEKLNEEVVNRIQEKMDTVPSDLQPFKDDIIKEYDAPIEYDAPKTFINEKGELQTVEGETTTLTTSKKEEWFKDKEALFLERMGAQTPQDVDFAMMSSFDEDKFLGGALAYLTPLGTRDFDDFKAQTEVEWEAELERLARNAFLEEYGMFPMDSQGFMEEEQDYGIACLLDFNDEPTYYIARFEQDLNGEFIAVPVSNEILRFLDLGKINEQNEEIYENNFTADDFRTSEWGEEFYIIERVLKDRAEQRANAAMKMESKI
ncbi:cell envelope integrity protein TolA [Acinetobacter sp.]|uniref:cell envelope integrity protein TolA n=1 Tax=Acinetobacter sp. TaxID=472 RepID=UPI000C0BA85B|nr:cell envelope integrity protein TolA [Acinetobacter sp.]MAK29817.1 hypothetical protein [Acinetobacter sp.]|tara:strand:- start:631 stop:3435 length:2805 start_codon:yes stop_codon:yes gene_type:complete